MTGYTLAQLRDGTGFEPDARFEQVRDYNGWTNRETWAVGLHINNDQGWQEQVHDALREAAAMSLEPLTPSAAGDIIRENVERVVTVDGWAEEIGDDATDLPAAQSRIAEDIGSLYRVDWYELGANFLDALKDES